MYKYALLGICLVSTLSADPVCHKCELIREANKHKVNKYVYYEDYQNAYPNQPQVHHQDEPQQEEPKQQ